MLRLASALTVTTLLAVCIIISGCAGTLADSAPNRSGAGTVPSATPLPRGSEGAQGPLREDFTPRDAYFIGSGSPSMAPPRPSALSEFPARLPKYAFANARNPSASSSATARHPRTTQSTSDHISEQLKDYAVVVAADKRIRIPGPPGEMKVWIGNPQFRPATTEAMHSGETRIPALSDTAKITPFTPGMDVAPKESVCEKIDPTGSEVRFQLKPLTKGTFRVGADVALYATTDCSGRPIPKTASTVEVEVAVDMIAKIEQRGDEVANETWKAFLAFWGKAVALVFALLLFLLRKRLLRRFGFKSKD